MATECSCTNKKTSTATSPGGVYVCAAYVRVCVCLCVCVSVLFRNGLTLHSVPRTTRQHLVPVRTRVALLHRYMTLSAGIYTMHPVFLSEKYAGGGGKNGTIQFKGGEGGGGGGGGKDYHFMLYTHAFQGGPDIFQCIP